MFHTYVTPEVYELIVKEVSRKRQWNINRVKTAYDIASVALGIILSFSFFGFGDSSGKSATGGGARGGASIGGGALIGGGADAEDSSIG